MPRSSTHRRAPSARHRPGFRVRLASGRDVETTLSHPFLTPQGWRALHDLSPGTLVAVPRRIPVFGALDLPAHEVGLLAYLTTGRTPPLDAEMLSARIARQAQHLLLRFGVVSVVAGNQLRIGPAGMVPLIREVGVFGHERLRRWARNQQRSLLGDVDVMWDPIVAIDETGAFQVYDLTVPRTHNFIANDVCVHNTTFCLNIAQHAALQQKTPVAIFSLESSNEQVVQRMLASEAEVDGSKLRTGFLSDTAWPKLAHALARLPQAPSSL